MLVLCTVALREDLHFSVSVHRFVLMSCEKSEFANTCCNIDQIQLLADVNLIRTPGLLELAENNQVACNFATILL